MSVTNALYAGAKYFRIDHPLDPTNKYLMHSAVESPEMMTVYNGNASTNDSCEVDVDLPSYFQALNRDFRYQLTVIGTFAQAIVAREIENNRFVIRTDKPNIRVSWQVTGVRKDRHAEAYRAPVEEDKPVHERGRFLHPELFKEGLSSATEELSVPIGHRPSMFGERGEESVDAKFNFDIFGQRPKGFDEATP